MIRNDGESKDSKESKTVISSSNGNNMSNRNNMSNGNNIINRNNIINSRSVTYNKSSSDGKNNGDDKSSSDGKSDDSNIIDLDTLTEKIIFDPKTSQSYLCPICIFICINPVACESQGHLMCQECANKIIARGGTCPLKCDEKTLKIFKDHRAKREINSLVVECTDCKEKFEFSRAKDHLNYCSRMEVECKVPRCSFKGNKKQLAKHMSDPVVVERHLKCYGDFIGDIKVMIKKFEIFDKPKQRGKKRKRIGDDDNDDANANANDHSDLGLKSAQSIFIDEYVRDSKNPGSSGAIELKKDLREKAKIVWKEKSTEEKNIYTEKLKRQKIQQFVRLGFSEEDCGEFSKEKDSQIIALKLFKKFVKDGVS